jgi:hypothetical protein
MDNIQKLINCMEAAYLFRSIGMHLQDYTVSQPKIPHSEELKLLAYTRFIQGLRWYLSKSVTASVV